MELGRIKQGEEVRGVFAVSPGPCVALWLQCLLESHYVWHLGAAFRMEGETNITRIDQTDERLRKGEGIEPDDRWWVFLSFGREARAAVRAAMERLRRAAELPTRYGLIYAGGVIDAQGVYWPAPGEVGLNCASVVLAVFEGVAWPLVDRSSWAGRTLPPNALAAIELDLKDAEIAVFAGDQGSVVLPSEVAGACLFNLPRVSLADARRGADHFEEQARIRAETTAS